MISSYETCRGRISLKLWMKRIKISMEARSVNDISTRYRPVDFMRSWICRYVTSQFDRSNATENICSRVKFGDASSDCNRLQMLSPGSRCSVIEHDVMRCRAISVIGSESWRCCEDRSVHDVQRVIRYKRHNSPSRGGRPIGTNSLI